MGVVRPFLTGKSTLIKIFMEIMVLIPWFEDKITFQKTTEIGTKKVIERYFTENC